jgi:hypothetical protein
MVLDGSLTRTLAGDDTSHSFLRATIASAPAPWRLTRVIFLCGDFPYCSRLIFRHLQLSIIYIYRCYRCLLGSHGNRDHHRRDIGISASSQGSFTTWTLGDPGTSRARKDHVKHWKAMRLSWAVKAVLEKSTHPMPGITHSVTYQESDALCT